MAVTAAIVFVGHNSLRYLLVQDGAGGTTATITSTGAATPDLKTDSVAGPIKNLANAFENGFGAFAAGALTQVQARALWLSDYSGADPASGDPAGSISLIKTAICQTAPRTGATSIDWKIEANVDGGGHPTINITGPATAASCYLDVKIGNAIGA